MPPHVLIIDDELQIVNLLVDMLGRRNYRTTRALSGQMALEILAAETPDVILLDLAMPGIDGLDVLRYLQDTPRFHNTRVVAVTARPEYVKEANARQLHLDEVLYKPIRYTKLVNAIERFI